MKNFNLIKCINDFGIYQINPINFIINSSNILNFQNNYYKIDIKVSPINFFELSKFFSEKIIIELSIHLKIPIIMPNTKIIIGENWIKSLDTKQVIIFFLSKYNQNICNNLINKTKAKTRKKTIPVALKRKVWDYWVGEHIGKTKCPCCKLTDITQLNFSCGHIVAESNGGSLFVTNLRPICTSCNSSMGTKNMNEFIREFGL